MFFLFVIVGIIAWVNSEDEDDKDTNDSENSGGDNSGGDPTPSGTMYHGKELTPEYRLRKDGKTYCPLDMTGHGRSEEEEWEDCQKRCADTNGCLYFNFYENGGCHLSTGEEGTGCTSSNNPTSVSGRAFVPSYYSRLTPMNEFASAGTYYGPWLTGTDRSNSSWEDCQYRCADTTGCVYFNSYPNGGCHLSGSDATATVSSDNPTNKAGRALKP